MRIFAVLTLSAGLLFSAAAPGFTSSVPEASESPDPAQSRIPEPQNNGTAATSESPTPPPEDAEAHSTGPQEPADSEQDGDGTEPATETETETADPSPTETPDPSPTETPDPSPTDSPDPTPTETPDPTDSPSPTDPTTTPTDPPTTETPTPTPQESVSCTNITLTVGETRTVACSTVPADLTISLGSDDSSIGGSIEVSGNELIYSAPDELPGTVPDSFTVKVEGSDAVTQVTFTVLGGNDQPTISPTPTPTQTTPEPTQPPETTTAPTASPEPTRQSPTVSAPPPGVPSPTVSENHEGTVFLPVPGMPELHELTVPWLGTNPGPGPAPTPTASSGPDHEAGSYSPDGGALAQTGPMAVYTAAGISLLAVAFGSIAMRASRRFM